MISVPERHPARLEIEFLERLDRAPKPAGRPAKNLTGLSAQ